MSWKCTVFILVWALLLGLGKCQQGCSNIPDNLRFDCYPQGVANEQSCLNRGCCWTKPSIVDDEVPLDIPYCFYPNDYGYQLVNQQKTQTGFLLSLAKKGHAGPYGKDIENVAVDVRFEARNRLHFKVYDPNNKRYEVPIETPKVDTETTSPDYTVSVTNFPFGIAVKRKSTGTVLFNSSVGGMIFEDQFIQMSSLLPSSVLYGLGEHVVPLQLDVKWNRATLFARDQGGTPEGLTNLYGVFPYYISMENDGNANGVFLLNSNAMDVILQPTPAITYRTIGGILDFYVFLGPTPDQVVQQFTAVVGRPYMPPYWGLGFHLCRWGYGSLNGTQTVNANMRKYGIPQDVQWNDIEYMDKHLDFTVDQNKWGGLGDFVKKLHDNYHQYYIPIVDPGISSEQPQGSYPAYDVGLEMGVFINASTGGPIIGQVWPGKTVFPDFTYSETQVYWEQMLSQFRKLVEFDGLWIDMNEPSNMLDGSSKGCPANSPLDHPPYVPHVLGGALYIKTLCTSAKHHGYSHYDVHSLYGLTEMVQTMSALKKLRGKRTVVISRSTFASAGQHGGHWLGDNTATFNDMYLSIPGILNFNLFGVPLKPQHTPCCFPGPAAFGDDFARMASDVLMARYRLLPYLYTQFAQAHTLGSAVARPLFYEFPKDSRTYAIDRQFLLGPALLITPVLSQGSTSVKGYFPDATWYDSMDGSILQTSGGGGQQHTLPAPWDKINFHFRGGYIIPAQQPNITTYYSRQQPFELIVALSSSGEARGTCFMMTGNHSIL
ncbi:hypothetical protein OS493_003764 [Desmophyllum pertusum]|uniref:P-type domain-containing protein n=1 Tax=Desmophyllum pertusum TaxID=174260 RepID=A0A9X0A6L6_9CNID|nr:hypothetical protein OS493_003764 [Desmophyllum pertusum]